jgi:hypothetical protein
MDRHISLSVAAALLAACGIAGRPGRTPVVASPAPAHTQGRPIAPDVLQPAIDAEEGFADCPFLTGPSRQVVDGVPMGLMILPRCTGLAFLSRFGPDGLGTLSVVSRAGVRRDLVSGVRAFSPSADGRFIAAAVLSSAADMSGELHVAAVSGGDARQIGTVDVLGGKPVSAFAFDGAVVFQTDGVLTLARDGEEAVELGANVVDFTLAPGADSILARTAAGELVFSRLARPAPRILVRAIADCAYASAGDRALARDGEGDLFALDTGPGEPSRATLAQGVAQWVRAPGSDLIVVRGLGGSLDTIGLRTRVVRHLSDRATGGIRFAAGELLWTEGEGELHGLNLGLGGEGSPPRLLAEGIPSGAALSPTGLHLYWFEDRGAEGRDLFWTGVRGGPVRLLASGVTGDALVGSTDEGIAITGTGAVTSGHATVAVTLLDQAGAPVVQLDHVMAGGFAVLSSGDLAAIRVTSADGLTGELLRLGPGRVEKIADRVMALSLDHGRLLYAVANGGSVTAWQAGGLYLAP